MRRICDPIRIIAGNEIADRVPPIFCGLPPLTETLSFSLSPRDGEKKKHGEREREAEPGSRLSRDTPRHVNSHATICTDYRNNGGWDCELEILLPIACITRVKNLFYLRRGKN